MLEGFLLGMLLWVGPAVVGWLLVGPAELGKRFRSSE